MSLIKCSECGKEVSDKADKCPHCGNKLDTVNDIASGLKTFGCLWTVLITIPILIILLLML